MQKVMVERRKETLAEDEKRNEELFEQMSESFKKAEDSYYKSMDELPGGFKLMGMQVRQQRFFQFQSFKLTATLMRKTLKSVAFNI